MDANNTPAGAEVRPYGDGRHMVAYVPTDHPALKELTAAADWVATYWHRSNGRRPIAYDLGFTYGDRQQAAELGRWLAEALATAGELINEDS